MNGLQFLKIQSNIPYSTSTFIREPSSTQNISLFSFSGKRNVINQQIVVQNPLYRSIQPTRPVSSPSPSVPIEETPKKMKWGEPTWFLFHTISYKIKDEYFLNIREELLNTIYTIATNLPCPDCANHAKEYLDRVHFLKIKTKDELIVLLYRFHNELNQKKGFNIFPFENLNEKYSKANTINIIQNFMFHFQDRSRSIKLIATDLYRSRVAERLKGWFNTNIIYFEK